MKFKCQTSTVLSSYWKTSSAVFECQHYALGYKVYTGMYLQMETENHVLNKEAQATHDISSKSSIPQDHTSLCVTLITSHNNIQKSHTALPQVPGMK